MVGVRITPLFLEHCMCCGWVDGLTKWMMEEWHMKIYTPLPDTRFLFSSVTIE